MTRRPGASAANRGKRVSDWIKASIGCWSAAETMERIGCPNEAASYRRRSDEWAQMAAQETKWAAHYAGVALEDRRRK